MMRYLHIHRGTSFNELLEMSIPILEELFRESVEADLSQRRWDIRTSLLSHTPMSKEAGHAMSRELRELEKELKRVSRSVRKSPPIDKNAPIVSKVTSVEFEPGESESDYLAGKMESGAWQ